MGKKKRRPKLSDDANARIDLATQMTAEVLKRGGIPSIVIGSKPGAGKYAVDYFIVSPLPKGKIRYVLSRLAGLMDGSINESN